MTIPHDAHETEHLSVEYCSNIIIITKMLKRCQGTLRIVKKRDPPSMQIINCKS